MNTYAHPAACHDVRRRHDARGGGGAGGNDERPLPPGAEEDEGMKRRLSRVISPHRLAVPAAVPSEDIPFRN